MGEIKLTFMHKILTTIALSLLCTIAIAQNTFSNYILNGDVKMAEEMYSMALQYYYKARSIATAKELPVVEARIRKCNEAIEVKNNPQKGATKASASSAKLLFSDQYLEPGDIIARDGTLVPSESDSDMSFITIEVYTNRIVVLNHVDYDTEEELSDLPKGTVLTLEKETKEYRQYVSQDRKERFMISKEISSNRFGRYRQARHLVGDTCYVLFSSSELKQILEDSDKETDSPEEETDSPEEVQRASCPVVFTKSWVLNMDENGERFGDDRSEPILAKDVLYLVFRMRYDCPEDLEEDIVFDMKVYEPDGTLIVLGEEGKIKKGYSSQESLTTLPGGGIMNFSFGSNEKGNFSKGKYTVEVWYNGERCYSASTTLK